MNRRTSDLFPDVLARKLSRRAALATLAGGGIASTLTGAAGPVALAASQATPGASPAAFAAPAGTEILWDTWGTPHIYAGSANGLFYAFGWAQTHAHGDLLLRLYAQSRGRGAEIDGEGALPIDQIVRTMGLHARGATWYDAQPHEFRASLDAFAAGINAYAAKYPDRLDAAAQAVLPITGADTLAHLARIFFEFLADEADVLDVLLSDGQGEPGGTNVEGSNGWAIAPSHSERGHALLLANPHLEWAGEQTWFEAQLSAPGVYDAYGATLVGIPVLSIAFNDHLGWTHTSNTLDAVDLYALALDGDGYQFDGEILPFETRTETIMVLQEDGSMRDESLVVRRSVHGPVVGSDEPLAIRMAAVDDWSSAAGALQQWWDMGRATSLEAFEQALRRLQLPYFTVIYADRDGHVLSLFNGQVPVRPAGETDWSQPVAGDTSATLWTEIHPYDDLPRVLDPEGGWVQNSNCPPWYTAVPLALDPNDYPPGIAPQFLTWRERRGIRMLQENPSISLEHLVDLKYSSRMELADQMLDELVVAARESGNATASEAAAVLAAWDREALAGSTGTLLFSVWVQGMSRSEDLHELFSTAWDPADPLTMPSGLADPDGAVQALATAAEQVQAAFGRLDVPWGDVARVQRGDIDLPANGIDGNPFGVFRVLWFDAPVGEALAAGPPEGEASTEMVVTGGDSYVAAVEFGETVQAKVLLTYGNASQPGSPHAGDQLALSARGEMRTAWRTREEIEANLEAHDILG